jgi:hypothetical protein
MIMIQGPSPSAILTTLQSTHQTIEDWCKELRLEIAKEKSALKPMFIRKKRRIQTSSHNSCMGNKHWLKNEIPWYNTSPQVGLVSPHTISRKQVTVYTQQPCPLLQSYMGHVIPQPNDCL